MPFSRDGIFPTPSTDLKFNFGGPWRVRQPLDTSYDPVCTESWCLGIWDQRHFVEWPENTSFIGVSFKPSGAYAFLGVPLSELRNRVVPLEVLWPSAAEVREQLYDAATPARRFALLEEVLLARLDDNAGADRIVGHVAGQIVDRHGALKISELCDEVGISHKHLITLFDRMVGCPPKQLARLCRFEHTLESIDLNKPIRWTTVAQDGDYFDQAHFSHDFQNFAGLTPSAYLKHRRLILEMKPDHAAIPWVLPAC
jgi:AraC-like DNA-binding protein